MTAAYHVAGSEALSRGHYLAAELLLARANGQGAEAREALHRRVAAFRTRAEEKGGAEDKKTHFRASSCCDSGDCCSCCTEVGCECGAEVCATVCCEAVCEGLSGC